MNSQRTNFEQAWRAASLNWTRRTDNRRVALLGNSPAGYLRRRDVALGCSGVVVRNKGLVSVSCFRFDKKKQEDHRNTLHARAVRLFKPGRSQVRDKAWRKRVVAMSLARRHFACKLDLRERRPQDKVRLLRRKILFRLGGVTPPRLLPRKPRLARVPVDCLHRTHQVPSIYNLLW